MLYDIWTEWVCTLREKVAHVRNYEINYIKTKCVIYGVSLNPTINLRKAQQDDPRISKVIQMKTSRTPKHKLAAWRHDRNLVTFWHHYNKLFHSCLTRYSGL